MEGIKMENFYILEKTELEDINGGALEICLFGKWVLTGAAAGGVIGAAVVGLAGVAALGWYCASKN